MAEKGRGVPKVCRLRGVRTAVCMCTVPGAHRYEFRTPNGVTSHDDLRDHGKNVWFATLDEISRKAFWSPVWLRAKGNERLPLL